MIGDVLVNSYSYRIVEGTIGIAYDSDVQNSIDIIKNVLSTCENISGDNTPIVGIEDFGDSAINIGYRYWVPTSSYFKTQYEVNLKILESINQANITIPFPQREVRMVGAQS